MAAMGYLFTFGLGCAVLVWALFDPHWAWLLAAYCGGGMLGFGLMALRFMLSEAAAAREEVKQERTTVPPRSEYS